jgi:hypothetical protein
MKFQETQINTISSYTTQEVPIKFENDEEISYENPLQPYNEINNPYDDKYKPHWA